jgi:oxygen-dependent protoporphyrinogen oxidase
VLLERFVPPRSASGSAAEDDESLESFVVRRLGREAFERLVQPLAAGIWTADPARLSMAAACPEFLAMEREHGSLWAGERHRVRRGADGMSAGARYGQFLTLASGMETLPRRLAERLRAGGVSFLTATATRLERAPAGGWRISLESAGSGVGQAVSADAVVIAVPAAAASRIVSSLDRELAAELASIPYAGSAIISLGFARDDVPHPLDAAGMVVARVAGRRILAASFSSSKFPGRAPAGHVLIRVFAGGALDPETMQLDNAALEARGREEVAALLGVRGRPRLVQIDRWPGAMPQYHVGHLDRVGRIERGAAEHPALALAGAAYRGVGIPQVIASGQAAAQRILAALRAVRS